MVLCSNVHINRVVAVASFSAFFKSNKKKCIICNSGASLCSCDSDDDDDTGDDDVDDDNDAISNALSIVSNTKI